MFRRFFFLQGLAALLLCLSSAAQARAVTTEGTLNITGAVSVTPTSLDSCSVSVSLRGNFRNSLGEETPYAGVITFQFADRNFQQLRAGFAAGDFPTTTFSASFSPAEQPAP